MMKRGEMSIKNMKKVNVSIRITNVLRAKNQSSRRKLFAYSRKILEAGERSS